MQKMDFLLDGSETSWLVYADYLEDQGLDAKHIREPGIVNTWHFAYHKSYVGSIDESEMIGSTGYFTSSHRVGARNNNLVGGTAAHHLVGTETLHFNYDMAARTLYINIF
jgi:hypothetical protein